MGVVPLYPFALLGLKSVSPLLSYLLNSVKYPLEDITGTLPLSSFFSSFNPSPLGTPDYFTLALVLALALALSSRGVVVDRNRRREVGNLRKVALYAGKIIDPV